MAYATPRKLAARLPTPGRTLDMPLPRLECVRLPAVGQPKAETVRIYLGTEPDQYRAERVFIWSIQQVRDPERCYEIYLMSRLPGFDSRAWLTGFSNYRFAIPHLAGCSGKAIYNDVDQVYLRDPGRLFDLPLQDCAYRSISREDTSVMLLDCARMAQAWTLPEVRRERRRTLEKKALEQNLWGVMDGGWNARDEEYRRGESGLIHFTALHTQPWEPFPEQFVYRPNPIGDVWHALERSACEARFWPFNADAPSRAFAELMARGASTQAGNSASERALVREIATEIDDLARDHAVRDALQVTLTGTREQGVTAPTHGSLAWRYQPLRNQQRDAAPADLVLCHQTLEQVPESDFDWAVDRLFCMAGAAVVIGLDCYQTRRPTVAWWRQRIALVARRYPHIRWTLVARGRDGHGRHRIAVRRAGQWPKAPVTWLLSDGKPGHDSQSQGLADALGWPCEFKPLDFGPLARAQYTLLRTLGRIGANRLGLRGGKDLLHPPWPDLVIGTGWACAPIARWITRQSRGRTRTVILGRRGGRIASAVDAAVTCGHFRLPYAGNRITTVAPLHKVTRERLEAAAKQWPDLFAQQTRPRIVALVGGRSLGFRFDNAVARQLGSDLANLARERGGEVLALTSRRTGNTACELIEQALGEHGRVDRWQPGRADNPYLGALAQADLLVVTGESESMLAEACATGKPVYVWPLPAAAPTRWMRITEWVYERGNSEPRNRRGTVRPQQGLEYFTARLLQRAMVQPRRDMPQLHQALYEAGVARPFTLGDGPWQGKTLDEAQRVADQLRTVLQMHYPDPAARCAPIPCNS